MKQQNNQKHGIPTLISFFVPGIGQIIKGHWTTALGIWLAYVLNWGAILFISVIVNEEPSLKFVSLLLIPLYLMFLIIWVWNVYDAYNN